MCGNSNNKCNYYDDYQFVAEYSLARLDWSTADQWRADQPCKSANRNWPSTGRLMSLIAVLSAAFRMTGAQDV